MRLAKYQDKSVYAMVVAASLAVVFAALVWPLGREARATDELGSASVPLPDALDRISRQGTRVLMEVADGDRGAVRVLLPSVDGGPEKLIDALAKTTGGTRETVDGIAVIEPGTTPGGEDVDAHRGEMTRLAWQLENLPADQGDAIQHEWWLDLDRIPPAESELLLSAFGRDRPDAEDLAAWRKNRNRLTAGFLFDPYLQIRTLDGRMGRRKFLRTGQRIAEFSRTLSQGGSVLVIPATDSGEVRP